MVTPLLYSTAILYISFYIYLLCRLSINYATDIHHSYTLWLRHCCTLFLFSFFLLFFFFSSFFLFFFFFLSFFSSFFFFSSPVSFFRFFLPAFFFCLIFFPCCI